MCCWREFPRPWPRRAPRSEDVPSRKTGLRRLDSPDSTLGGYVGPDWKSLPAEGVEQSPTPQARDDRQRRSCSLYPLAPLPLAAEWPALTSVHSREANSTSCSTIMRTRSRKETRGFQFSVLRAKLESPTNAGTSAGRRYRESICTYFRQSSFKRAAASSRNSLTE